MILYHGTVLEVKEPQVITGEIGRDFGFAFYTTGIQEQAERWAVRKARIKTRDTGGNFAAVVNVYEWDEQAEGITVKLFAEPSREWLDMIVQCRSNMNYKHSYDIVIGKIADDSVGETVTYVVQGIMRPEDAINRLKFEKLNNQVAFCTAKSLGTLSFLKSYIVGGR